MKYVLTLYKVDEVAIIPKPNKLPYDPSPYIIHFPLLILSTLFEKELSPKESESLRITKPPHCTILNSAQNILRLTRDAVINSRGKENSFGNHPRTFFFKIETQRIFIRASHQSRCATKECTCFILYLFYTYDVSKQNRITVVTSADDATILVVVEVEQTEKLQKELKVKFTNVQRPVCSNWWISRIKQR